MYVDDILITGYSSIDIQQLFDELHHHFALKDLGPVHYFLGFEVCRQSSSMHLSQSKYAIDLLRKTNMENAKPCPTPMSLSNKLSSNDSAPFVQASLYRSTIGSLQYLTYTRPDISFSVSKLCQFLQAPTINHWKACK